MAAVYERGGVWYPVPKPVPIYRVMRDALLNALAYTNGHQGEAAQLLGLSQRQMTYNMKVYHIPTSRNVRLKLHKPRAAIRLRRVK